MKAPRCCPPAKQNLDLIEKMLYSQLLSGAKMRASQVCPSLNTNCPLNAKNRIRQVRGTGKPLQAPHQRTRNSYPHSTPQRGHIHNYHADDSHLNPQASARYSQSMQSSHANPLEAATTLPEQVDTSFSIGILSIHETSQRSGCAYRTSGSSRHMYLRPNKITLLGPYSPSQRTRAQASISQHVCQTGILECAQTR